MNYVFRSLPAALAALLFVLHPLDLLAAQSRHDKRAQALARQLAPSGVARKVEPGAKSALGKRLIAIVEVLERSYRTSGPTPESLLRKAFSFRDDVGNWEELVLTDSLLDAWRDANAMGLFDDDGSFRNRITKGRGVGESVGFELIVPGEAYPPASNQLANLRFVREDARRDPASPLTPRESAMREQLKKLVDEKQDLAERSKWENRTVNALGRTAGEELLIWEKKREEAGDAANEMPEIRIAGDLEATPSNMTKDRWRVGCEVTNLSNYPTRVKVEIWLLGYTDKKRRHYVMAKSEHDLRLVSSQSHGFDVFTRAKNSYKSKADDVDELSKKERKKSRVRYRGYVMTVTHEKGLVTFTGSDQAMAAYADPDRPGSSLLHLPVF